ncbi:proline-rich protein LAS17-like [Panicum hallii]|uniref:proline-rich protein LAS17-like n=1 Tax=Panicum hallii TaxID=206008 RepID=UPI000DF4CB4E|nr:proline-rich protein LAS17-like [Panicum hallii]
MDGYDAGGRLTAASASPHAEEAINAVRDDACARLHTPSDEEEDCDDLYGDVNVGFLPLLPLSPSPAPTSPPKTPSPGCSILSPSPSPSPPPPPHRAPAPEPQPQPQREHEARPEPATPRHQPPRPPPPPPGPPGHHVPPQPPRGGGASASYSSPPRYTALYISDLHWWTTDAEVEAALELAPHGAAAALCGLHFYSEKFTGKSRGICRAEFLNAAAAASAAATLQGRAFHGRHCVASPARPAALHRLGDHSDSCAEAAPAPNPTRGLGGRGASHATTGRGNVGPVLGDRPTMALLPLSVFPRPSPGSPFGGIMRGVGGYGGFQSIGQYNMGMGCRMMPSPMPPHVNPSFLAAGGMAMRGPGVWHDQGMAGGLWGAQQEWNFRGCQMPWRQLAPPAQHHQVQQHYGNGDYGKGRGMRRERPGSRGEDRGIGTVSYPDRRQSDRDGVDWYKEHDREEKGQHRERVLEKERERERHWNERDRHGGDKRRRDRGQARSRSQSRDGGGDDDDRPRRRH